MSSSDSGVNLLFRLGGLMGLFIFEAILVGLTAVFGLPFHDLRVFLAGIAPITISEIDSVIASETGFDSCLAQNASNFFATSAFFDSRRALSMALVSSLIGFFTRGGGGLASRLAFIARTLSIADARFALVSSSVNSARGGLAAFFALGCFGALVNEPLTRASDIAFLYVIPKSEAIFFT